MQNRKRVNESQKQNTEFALDYTRRGPILIDEEVNDEDILSKYIKDSSESYFATPGQCTRSKTVKLNPFDLSNPEPKNTHFDNFISSKRMKLNSTSRNKRDSSFRHRSSKYENSLDSGLDTGSICESILSFASRSSDENSNSSFPNLSVDSSWSENSKDVFTKLKETSRPVNNCSETGYILPIVRDSSSENVLIPQISGLTLANILSGNHTLDNKLTIFDCRFPYEYSGGHIANSINVHCCQKLLQTLFPIKQPSEDRKPEEDIKNLRKKLKRDDSIYVFYCEFSSYRAPKLAQCLRGLDRLAHFGNRDLFIPNIYVLFGGYCDFFKEYPQFCTPNRYVSMKQTRYSLRNSFYLSEHQSVSSTEICQNEYRKEVKRYFQETQESERKLRSIISRSTKDSDILQLFLSHPIIGGS